jgi:adenylate cyclase
MDVFRRTTLICLVTAVVGGVLILSPAGGALEQGLGLSWLFRLRGPVSAPSDVLVVNVDEASAVRLDQPTRLREWDRSLHADLVRRLSDRGASAIVFDVFFDKSGANNSDIEFAREIEQSKKVVLVQQVARDQHDQLTIDRLINPVPDLSGAAIGLAPFPLPKIGNRFGHFWAFYSGVNESPTLPVVALQVHVIGLYGYESFMALLKHAGFQGADESPASISKWSDLQLLMKSLRTVLRANPQIHENLRAQLNDSDSARALLALAETYTGDDSYSLNFYGPPSTVTTVQYSDFWRDSETQRKNGLLDLSNKTVFIGGAAQPSNMQGDGFFTVFSSDDGVDIGGVEIAATAFANILEHRTLRPTSKITNLGIVLMFGILIAFIARKFNGVLTALFVIAGGTAYFTLSYHLFANHQIWTPLVTPIAVQLPLALSLAYLAQYLNARRAREKYSRAIRYYVPERVARRFDEGQDPATRPELVFGVCMSTDIEGYTTLSERIPEAELAGLTSRYFEFLAPCVDRQGGETLEVRGDGMICLWSTPTEDKTLSHRASLAAHDILETVQRFNEQNKSQQLPTRIGLHAGRVALVNVGGGGHLAYSVVGDSINTAARIQDLNKVFGTKLLASAAVVRDLDDWLYRRVCLFQPKGKQEVLSIYEIIGPGDAVTRGDNDLCMLFAMAYDFLAQADWAEAEKAFTAILQSHPGDGPSQFYLQRSRQYLVSPPPPGEQIIIRTDAEHST